MKIIVCCFNPAASTSVTVFMHFPECLWTSTPPRTGLYLLHSAAGYTYEQRDKQGTTSAEKVRLAPSIWNKQVLWLRCIQILHAEATVCEELFEVHHQNWHCICATHNKSAKMEQKCLIIGCFFFKSVGKCVRVDFLLKTLNGNISKCDILEWLREEIKKPKWTRIWVTTWSAES